MRHLVLPVLIVCASAWAAFPDEQPVTSADQGARANQALQLARKAAGQYSLRFSEGDAGPFTLQPEPLLKFSNPVIGSAYGAVFVYTSSGRPEAIASVYKWYAPARHMGVEFHTLSLERITAAHEGQDVWLPSGPGVALKPVPDAPAPAASPAARLRQLRALAETFAATQTNESGIARELRLLTKPLYRYRTDNGKVLDGALFAFVQGTDPEAILLLEARPDAQGKPEWHYALARMTFRQVDVSQRGRKVWNAPLNDLGRNSKQQDRRATYTEFVFQPGEGLNPVDEEPAPRRGR